MNNNTTLTLKSKTKKLDFSFVSLMLSFFIVVIMLLILFSPTRYAQSVINGTKLFFTAVFPGLLPFMFLTRLLTELNVMQKLASHLNRFSKKLFGISGNGLYAFLMSTISGYPIGSKITADLYKKGLIGDAELTKCAIISSTSGPIFVIGAVGGAMLKSPLCGVIIYLSNIVAVVISMVLINLFSKRKNLDIPRAPEVKERTKTPLYKLVSDIVVSLLIVGFYIALFSLLIDLLNDLHILSALSTMSDNILGVFGVKAGYSSGIMSGIVEMTNGAKALSFEISPLSVSLISFVIGFSGLSIIMQSLSFLSETKIKTRHFIGAKLLHGTLTFLICLALTSLIL